MQMKSRNWVHDSNLNGLGTVQTKTYKLLLFYQIFLVKGDSSLDVIQSILLFSAEKATLQLDYKESRAQDTFGRPPSVRFRRRQSDLYQMTHPSPDPEMETELLEEALRQVNDQLITEKECQYIFYVCHFGASWVSFGDFCGIKPQLSEHVSVVLMLRLLRRR